MLCIDLFCGLGGWTDGFLAEGYSVVGFDIEARPYPADLVLQDVLTLHGSQFRYATVIVASPPCQKYSYMAMPWSKAKALIAWHRENPERVKALNALFDACFRIQYEACEAAGRYIPMVVENVKGAQPWVGKAKANYGSFYLWGDVDSIGGRIVKAGDVRWGAPAIRASRSGVKCGGPAGDDWFAHHNRDSMLERHTKNEGGSWFAQANNTQSGHGQNPDGRKRPGQTISAGFNNWPKDENGAYVMPDGTKVGGEWFGEYAEQKAAGTISPGRLHGHRSEARKAASAQIAKIPFPLAQHIARIFKAGDAALPLK